MDPVHRYDEVHSVSDLHFGGGKGFQVFRLGETLAQLIDHLTERPKSRRVALVINGDFVDFLAEDPALYFDPVEAVDKLQRIHDDPAFKPVFDALGRFAARENRFLIITLGNHDLELALPWVSERLLELLAAGNAGARGRITLSFDGCGFLCGVGRKRVLFVHGNEVDTWNLCDYERLRRLGRDLTQNRRVEAWTPNAGAKMVIDVMNSIKRQYPFIDLLKPETEAAVPVLLAIDPGQASKMRRVLPIVGRRVVDSVRRTFGFLSVEDDENGDSARDGEAELRRIVESRFTLSTEGVDVDDMLDRVEDRIEQGESAHQVLDRDRGEEYLSVTGAIWKALRGAKQSEVVREAFQGLRKDQSFDLGHEDQTFEDVDALVGPEIDYLITGHTHLERRIRRKNGSGTYFNSGTWIRLMRLTEPLLGSAPEFERVYKLFSNSTMQDLDDFTYRVDGTDASLVLLKPALVSISEERGGVRAELQRVDVATGKPRPVVGGSEGGGP